MEERNGIVIYKNETIWASQKAIAALFGYTKQNVAYHISTTLFVTR